MVLSASGGTSTVLRSVTNIAFSHDIDLKEVIEQALGRNCYICLISWVLAVAYDDALTNRSTCHTKYSRRICEVQVL